MAKAVRISLANKCQLLFGAAVILIVSAALAVVWIRLQKLVDEGLEDRARGVADMWLNRWPVLPETPTHLDVVEAATDFSRDMALVQIDRSEFEAVSRRDPFLAETIRKFQGKPDRRERSSETHDSTGRPYYRYVRAIRTSDLERRDFGPGVASTGLADPLEGVLLVQFRADQVQRQQMYNHIFIITAGLVAMLLAIGVFWFITTRIILSPVRVLRDTAEQIAEGDTNIRSDINTGDEFEQLSDAFNTMVTNLNGKEQELRQINKSLDLRLGELAEHNVALYEANQIKDEFLANVSHELRTPLHSIIGFAEVLQETLRPRTGPVDEKRKRYIANIITSSRRLLDLINDLLDLAKIEAGRAGLNIGPMSVADTVEGLANLIRPQAEKGGIQISQKVERNIPLIRTDAGKVQQIVFNFLSNAVKFTPRGGAVTLSSSVEPHGPDRVPRLRLSVRDTGPGIAPEMHEKIFEKFTQLESTVTREHGGTGLGLTISRDLAELLQGEIELESVEGEGATFNLLIPFELESRTAPLMPDAVPERAAQPG